jgi:hypothetical protein
MDGNNPERVGEMPAFRKMNRISIQSVDTSGVTFSRGGGKERETAEVSWESLYELAGTSGGCGAHICARF